MTYKNLTEKYNPVAVLYNRPTADVLVPKFLQQDRVNRLRESAQVTMRRTNGKETGVIFKGTHSQTELLPINHDFIRGMALISFGISNLYDESFTDE